LVRSMNTLDVAALFGARVLIVEDDAGIGRALRELLTVVGAVAVGPARSVAEAMTLYADPGCDLAILDYRLGGETVADFADHLITTNGKFLFYTSAPEVKGRYPQAILIEKPGQLMDIIGRLIEMRR